MKKISVLFILSFVSSSFLVVYGQSNSDDLKPASSEIVPKPNIFDKVIEKYVSGVRFIDAIPVAIGILVFSYFIWKTSSILSKRRVFIQKVTYTASGTRHSLNRKRISYAVKYFFIFPIIMYGWVVVCFFFMWTLNTSLNFDVLTLIMIGIVSASRIAAHWNEKLAEDIMKFLPFNLLFTFLLNPNLDLNKITEAIQNFPPIMLELTIFIVFIGILEIVLTVIYFVISKTRHTSNSDDLPIN